ncbi:ATP-binding cassette domain-containing protein [Saccharopolyspora sp. TS4A08]|uniref:ATP-binding cassette domain-containing protein n=1 Tax=Saccharopolyspora ipomoeae TaxID=3042027 RepID=A0ABT6PVG1_9PSEU|nr:ATP-binding cassette domain-containing protein [Saccharopolyspora sp. TS4A08]MDI2032000.1 ATP-binding cassette domain-containing protein [Saccharopolyspora sp. TS4A08]
MTAVAAHDITISAGERTLLAGASFTLPAGQITALVGESGSGKTTLARVLLGDTPAGIGVSGEVEGIPSEPGAVGHIPQQPSAALNPVRRVGSVLAEIARLHVPKPQVRERVLEALRQAQMPDGHRYLRRYPHQLSGGQQQRVVLAQALIGRPRVLIADEPTTGQDPVIRAQLAAELRATAEQGIAILLLTHDLELVREIADRVLTLADGHLTESEVDLLPPGLPTPQANSNEPILRVRGLRAAHGRADVLHGIDLDVAAGERVAVLGRSGSGKTTLARCLAGLHRFRGEVLLDDHPLPPVLRRRTREQLARVQYVFQDSRASFDEFTPVLHQVARTAERLRGTDRDGARARATAELAALGLPEPTARRLPSGLSGGELQRAALVRATLAEPDVLICDEITSGLDARHREDLLRVLTELQANTGCALLMITHDVRAVAALTHRTLVLHEGRAVEHGPTTDVLESPQHPATADLVRPARPLAQNPGST